MADDVGIAEGRWWDESIVEVIWDSPASNLWLGVGELEGWRVAWKTIEVLVA